MSQGPHQLLPKTGKNELDNDSSLIASLRPYKTAIAAGASGTVGTLVGYPFDCLKTRMQTADYPSMNACARLVLQNEGVGAFWRGIASPLVSVTLIKAFSFTVYVEGKNSLIRRFCLGSSDAPIEEYTKTNYYSTLPCILGAGATSGFITSLICTPLELIKIQMQLQRVLASSTNSIPLNENTFSCGLRLLRSHGLPSLYSSTHLHALRDSLGTAFYFGFYETFKHTALDVFHFAPSPLVFLLAGGCSGTFSWLVGFPIDLIKSRIQKEAFLPTKTYNGFWDCFRKVKAQSGVRGLYSGMVPTLVRAFPIHSINFLVYESVLRLFS
ncbi:mitochondrial carrier [Basidiobolus meristosporus CBS 931.73]|uniref:Mitochondrial carrier n=1 Tax=Basidiobolus meristosporus CBS 931.73 TaxID=1314790 RepID=A0A1Y1Z2U2_9FUNG|nr:mitochondrial carrier [Basidiobolus meristosporus CBS 931.73]|eukprot:ORY04601.1 mitochondrial carrier [Basidiobolus meristosporus CBS 931.73]